MLSIPVRSAEDPRMNPLFWTVKHALIQHFGPKLPFKPVSDLMRSVRDANRLSLAREATRKKDIGIAWLCEHWDFARSILADQPRFDEEQHSRECDMLAGSWSKMIEIENLIRDLNGERPSMKQLVGLAKRLAAHHRLRLGREPRRNQKFLLAWYAEHWGLLESEVLEFFGKDSARKPYFVHPVDEPWIIPLRDIEAEWDRFPVQSSRGAWDPEDFGDLGSSSDGISEQRFFDPDDSSIQY
jgi:hypothetical protein